MIPASMARRLNIKWSHLNIDCVYLYVFSILFIIVFNFIQISPDTCPEA